MLGDELDIYDDLDDFQEAEEKKSKELQAWETKYENAQVEISTLQEHNKSLEKKVRIMEVNFQNLLDTAKAEIKRKDALITQLRKEKDDLCFRRKKPERFGPVDGKSKLQASDQGYNRFISEKTVGDKNTNSSQGIGKDQFCHKGIKEGDKTLPKSEPNAEQERSLNNISGKRSSVESKTLRNTCTERMCDRDRADNTVDQRKEDQERMHNRKKIRVGDRQDREHTRGRAADRENNDRDCSRERNNKYRDRAEAQNKGHRDHRSHSRKTEENIASREKKERNEKCERSVDEKREDRERKPSRERSRSRRHTSRSRQIEDKSSHRENRKTEDLKTSPKSRSRSPLEKNHTNRNTSDRHKRPTDEKRNKSKTRSLLSDTRSRRSSPKKNTTGDSNSADSTTTKELHKLMDNAEQLTPMDVVTPPSCTERENKSTAEEAASINEQNTVGNQVEKITICEMFENIPGLDLIGKNEVKELKPNNTQVQNKSSDETHEVERSEPLFKNIQNDSKQNEQVPGLDLIHDAGATEPDLKNFHHISEKFEPCLNGKNVAELEPASLDEELITEPKITDLPINQQTTEITELQKGDKVNDAVSKENTNQDKSIENISVKETEINTNAARTDIITVITAESEVKSVKKANEREGANPSEVSSSNSTNAVRQTKANTTIKEMKELRAADADKNDSTNSVKETMNEFDSNNSEHCIVPQVKEATINFQDTVVISEENTPTPNRPTTPPAQKLADSFQNVKVDLEDDTPTPKRTSSSPTQKATESSQNKEDIHTSTIGSPLRSSKDIQIIEDIRLPVMVDIEHIAVSVDKLNETQDQDKPVQPEETELRKEPDAVVENRGLNEEESSVHAGSITEPMVKESEATETVLYAQPDSTKIDHNDDETETAVNANMEIMTTPEKLMADNLNASYPNLKLEFDNIEMALEQLHQQSKTDMHPDEETVTSTSMKAPKDLIKILMQSPAHKEATAIASNCPIIAKSSSKKIGARTASERKKSVSITPERLEKTPIKKIKLSSAHDAQTVPQTPPKTANSPESEDITIDETIDESAQVENSNLGIGETSIVTKRCSLGNSDYQFEKVNDQVVLRITRRGRRRVASALSVNEIK